METYPASRNPAMTLWASPGTCSSTRRRSAVASAIKSSRSESFRDIGLKNWRAFEIESICIIIFFRNGISIKRIFPPSSQRASSQVLSSARFAFFGQFLFGVCSGAGVRQSVWHDDLGRIEQLPHRVPGRGDLIDGCLVSDRHLGHAQAAQFVDSLGHGDVECPQTPAQTTSCYLCSL